MKMLEFNRRAVQLGRLSESALAQGATQEIEEQNLLMQLQTIGLKNE